jgi:DNA-binding response OmpR family regulator
MANILVAEDDFPTRSFITAVLKKEGHVVEAFDNGLKASVRMLDGGIDLVVSDVEMPLRNGFELIKEIRGNAAYASLPCILLTSLSERSNMRIGMMSGADDYITKPFEPADLVDAVNHQLDRAMARLAQTAEAVSASIDSEVSQRTNDLFELYEKKLQKELSARWSSTDTSPSQVRGTLVSLSVAQLEQWLKVMNDEQMAKLAQYCFTKVTDNAALFGAEHLQYSGEGMLVAFGSSTDTESTSHRDRCMKFLASLQAARSSVQSYVMNLKLPVSELKFNYCAVLHEATLNLAKLDGVTGGIEQVMPIGASIAELTRLSRAAQILNWPLSMSDSALAAYAQHVHAGPSKTLNSSASAGRDTRLTEIAWKSSN